MQDVLVSIKTNITYTCPSLIHGVIKREVVGLWLLIGFCKATRSHLLAIILACGWLHRDKTGQEWLGVAPLSGDLSRIVRMPKRTIVLVAPNGHQVAPCGSAQTL
jgi:hypothetical protein